MLFKNTSAKPETYNKWNCGRFWGCKVSLHTNLYYTTPTLYSSLLLISDLSIQLLEAVCVFVCTSACLWNWSCPVVA